MKTKYLYWAIPVGLLVIALVLFTVTKSNIPVCGDGLCQKEEINVCEVDCKEQCSTQATDEEIEKMCSIGWLATYDIGLQRGFVRQEWMTMDNEINFLDPTIQTIAKTLRRTTVKDTARAIAEWTYQNIDYESTDEFSDCYKVTASSIIERKTGVCSTMSKVNIALLRANGIPAYSTTGCLKFNEACKLQQTFFTGRFPKVETMQIDESGYYPTKGYLHNWVVFTIYDNGEWKDVIMESTSGRIYESSCVNYRDYYENPQESLVCGLNVQDPNVADCEAW